MDPEIKGPIRRNGSTEGEKNFKTPYGRECFCLTGTTIYENARFRVEAYVSSHRPEGNIVTLQKTIDLAL